MRCSVLGMVNFLFSMMCMRAIAMTPRKFPVMINRFNEFLETLPDQSASMLKPEVTILFDKGNNSADNIALLDHHRFHFIGSVKLDEHKDLGAHIEQGSTLCSLHE